MMVWRSNTNECEEDSRSTKIRGDSMTDMHTVLHVRWLVLGSRHACRSHINVIAADTVAAQG